LAASVISAIERERKKTRKQIIDEHYQNRSSIRDIADDLGISEVWARQLVREAGYEPSSALRPREGVSVG
jgi:DNA-directed RNA polymerase specialized sigma subunit